jgi:hypothetical protein
MLGSDVLVHDANQKTLAVAGNIVFQAFLSR